MHGAGRLRQPQGAVDSGHAGVLRVRDREPRHRAVRLACGSPLEAQAPPEEERKPVTALFVDIVGSTSRAEELDPENVLALLEPYYARLRHELERHGGTVEKFIGDAVVAVFGAPAVHEDDAERAVRAAFAVVDAIHRLNEEDPSRDLKVRVGVTTGCDRRLWAPTRGKGGASPGATS